MLKKVGRIIIILLIAGITALLTYAFVKLLSERSVSISREPSVLILPGLAILGLLSFILKIRPDKDAKALTQFDILDDLNIDDVGRSGNVFLKVAYLLFGIAITGIGLFSAYNTISNPLPNDIEYVWIPYTITAGLLGIGTLFILDWMKIK
ncbi:MAG: hypothetical protein AAFX87_03500 [Bacteroidota bacterium]